MLGLLAALGLALPSTSDRSCELLDRVLLATRAQTNCSTISNVDVPGYVGPKWTMAEETCFLYLIGRHSEGAIAEQGPFLGASTIAIAFGIRDSSQPRRLFTTSDAFPVPASSFADGSRRDYPHYWRKYRDPTYSFPWFWPFRRLVRDGGVAMHIDRQQVGTIPLHAYHDNVAPYNAGPNGQMGTLVSNLHAAGVSHMVDVLTASHVPRGVPFEVVWSDSTHNVKEIHANVPSLLRPARLLRAQTCSTLAFHDINPDWHASHQIVAVNQTSALMGERRAAIEEQLRRAGCVVRRRVAAGLIYAVTVRCAGAAATRTWKQGKRQQRGRKGEKARATRAAQPLN